MSDFLVRIICRDVDGRRYMAPLGGGFEQGVRTFPDQARRSSHKVIGEAAKPFRNLLWHPVRLSFTAMAQMMARDANAHDWMRCA
jgi:hypothetical protein